MASGQGGSVVSRVMQIGAQDDVFEKARRAIHDAKTLGQIPMSWLMGRQVYNQLRHGNCDYYSTTKADSLLGLPFDVKEDAPPDLLELDAF